MVKSVVILFGGPFHFSLPLAGRVDRPSPVGVGVIQMCNDRLNDAVEMLIDIGIPKPQDTKPSRCEKFIPPRISLMKRLASMLPAVGFDDQPMFEAYEIDDIILDRRLSSEMKAIGL